MEKRNTSITLNDHFRSVIQYQLDKGYYANASEVMRAAMTLFEEKALQMEGLRAAIKKGEDSGYISSEECKRQTDEHRKSFIGRERYNK